MRGITRVGPVAFLALWTACSSAPGAAPPGDAGSDLATSLSVEVGAEAVQLVLHVTNPTRSAVQLEFGTGQRYDFSVRTGGGEEVWRWGADRMFTQAAGTETLAAGGSLRYVAEWRPGPRRGTFQAVGRIVSTNRPLEERTSFEVR
jgi:hypothetical protein